MDLKEINAIIDNVEQEVNKSARGNDEKHILGLAVRGIWEIARQIALASAPVNVLGTSQPVKLAVKAKVAK